MIISLYNRSSNFKCNQNDTTLILCTMVLLLSNKHREQINKCGYSVLLNNVNDINLSPLTYKN